MHDAAQNFPWADELEKTIVRSLATSFGLDFLLIKDKVGGDVDTVHNVRKKIWATELEKQKYQDSQAKDYDSKAYHSHDNYKAVGAKDKKSHEAGTLQDVYRSGDFKVDEKRNLDHVISAKEIDADPGRVLAELNGVELANQSSNLQTTHESINKSKKQTPISDYLSNLPSLINQHEATLEANRRRLASLPQTTPEQKNRATVLADKIRKIENKLKQLKAIDPEAMRARDAEARLPYEQQVNHSYYTSSKFLKQTATASAVVGLGMGARQVLGLVMAEVWFELRIQLPELLARIKHDFSFEAFLTSIDQTLRGIWQRVSARFHDFLMEFKNGFFAGVMSSVTTTLFNILATTQKMAVKIIREVWSQFVQAIKLMVFNPDQLSFVELCKAVTSLLAAGSATAVGTMAYAQLLPMCSFPFGGELAAFASALVTGVVTLGLNYFMLHSAVAQKLWKYVESLMPNAGLVKDFQAINAELDRYLLELGKLEFNIDTDELFDFSKQLDVCSNESSRSVVLQAQLKARNVELPFDMNGNSSARDWLASLI